MLDTTAGSFTRWYVARTEPRREHLAVTGLIRQGLKPYLPEFYASRRCGHRRRNVLEPMLPGYVFLPIPTFSEPWEAIRGVNGILEHRPFLTVDGHPKAISEAIVQAVRTVEATFSGGDHSIPLPQRGLYVGQAVEVEFSDAWGTVSAFKAIVENIVKLDRQGRIRVIAEWLGGLRPIEVQVAQIRTV